MTISEPRYLRLVRHAQYLIRLRQLLEFETNRFAYTPADASIDLIKHDGARKLRTIRHRLQHQHQTRCFTTRRHAREWLNVLANVCGKVKLRVVDTFLSRSFNIIRYLNLKPRVIDRDFRDPFLDRLLKLLRRAHTFFVQLTRQLQI